MRDLRATRRLSVRAAIAAGVGLGLAGTAAAQTGLGKAVNDARSAWLVHEVERLVAQSDTIRLQLPGIAVSHALRPGQAARLLYRYLKPSTEKAITLRQVRRLADDHAYAELVREFVVKGTDEERSETVFLGFRYLDGAWRLREVRITP